MAEEKAKKFNFKIIIIGLVLFILGGAGVFGFTVFFSQKGDEPEKEPVKVESSGILVKAGEFTVNIADPGGKRYLKTEVHLEVQDEKQKPELETRLPIVQDRILAVLSSKTMADLEVYNRDNLRQELLNQINDALGKKAVILNVYFTVFVTQ